MARDYFKNVEIVQRNLDRRTLLEGLAEEATELAQAALKAIRAEELNGNVTPVSIEEANKNLLEEIADVTCCADALGIPSLDRAVESMIKLERWANRLEPETDDEENNG